MEITGKVFKILPLATGEGKNGTWQKQEFVVDVPGAFPKKICFSLWGDKVQQFPLTIGEEVVISFDLESREFKERWYTEAKAWKVAKAGSGADDLIPPPEAQGNLKADDLLLSPNEPDDLPF